MKANISGLKIKELRLAKKLGQVDLATAMSIDYDIKIDQSDISEIERQARGVKDYELKAIAEIFSVTVDSLLVD